jgi:hypothetical protein
VKTIAQPVFDFIKNDLLEEMANMILRAKEDMDNIGQGIKSQGELLKGTLDMLNEIQATLSDMRQGELFDDESTETANGQDDVDCKNEIFEELESI